MKVKDDPELMALIEDSLNILDKIEIVLDEVKNHYETNKTQKSDTAN